MKKILVLGGGVNQLPLIETAKTEGYYVIVCDYNHEPPGAKLCDKFYEDDASDKDILQKIAIKEKIDGIIANTEALMENVSFISEKLGLVGNAVYAVQNLISKNKFRELQKATNLYSPRHVRTNDLNEGYKKTADFFYPIIVKPNKNSGSRGTTVIISREEKEKFVAAFQACKDLSRDHEVVIEEFIEPMAAEEVEAEIFVHNGEILWDGLLLTMRNEALPLLPITDIYPLPYDDKKISIIKKELKKAISAAGIVHGEYNAELYFTKNNELFILEINPRQGGDSIPLYVHKSCGVNLNKLLVTTAVGDDYYWNELKTYKRTIQNITYYPLFSIGQGIFIKLDIDKRIKKYITKIELFVRSGDIIYAAENATFKIGYIELLFPDKQIQMQISKNIWKYVRILLD